MFRLRRTIATTTVFFLLSLLPHVNSTSLFCPLENKQLVLLAKNFVTDTISVYERLGENATADNEHIQKHQYSNIELFYARECDCFGSAATGETLYCPYDLSHCEFGSTSYVQCVNAPKKYEGRILYGVIILFVTLFVYLIFSQTGRLLMDYCMVQCLPTWNNHLIDIMIHDDPDRVRSLYNAGMMRSQTLPGGMYLDTIFSSLLFRNNNQQQDESNDNDDDIEQPTSEDNNENVFKPITSLRLRTKIFRENDPPTEHESSSDDQSDEISKQNSTEENIDENDNISQQGDSDCSICFEPLRDGDRVGALACEHNFHMECLKIWLSRRNACPLCQRQVATPCYDEREEA